MKGYVIKVNKLVYQRHKMSGYKKHWEFRSAWNSHQIPELHQSWWQSLSEPSAPLPGLVPSAPQWPNGDKQGEMVLVYFSLRLCLPHSHGSPKHIPDLLPTLQLLQLLETTTGRDFSHSRDFSSVWPPGVPIPSTPRSGCCVNKELGVTSSSAHPAGCTSTFCSAGNSPKAHRILSLFIFPRFIPSSPPPPTGLGR